MILNSGFDINDPKELEEELQDSKRSFMKARK
jgi:hypothetical protein